MLGRFSDIYMQNYGWCTIPSDLPSEVTYKRNNLPILKHHFVLEVGKDISMKKSMLYSFSVDRVDLLRNLNFY